MAIVLLYPAVATMTPASASVASGFVGGRDVVYDDWADEGPLDSSSHRRSAATGLWQWVLHADGYYSGPIDCDYGPATTAATKAFQRANGLAQDGSAGPLTMGAADRRLVKEHLDYVRYQGLMEDIWFKRVNDAYQVYLFGGYKVASYTSTTAC
ncbi:peptidoglycan-binding domain-containing protein [Plantactinospora sp. KLBMP9567]|uniref:peptidoglycan-binding domain-containing protein n=1 Tax=Plantactinospora sp. KLBMP9567 TaxID=3085900 RepID=UPI002981D90D|nr:peptidoglycan-binding domain-containing protein [Plantactinospora sp. KLBMP9567]MDW5325051.1 peptidoglycan-binding domain-containing protein [Plantactinospora sp. KLBMP9567]